MVCVSNKSNVEERLSPFGGVEAEVAIGVGGDLKVGTGTAGGEVCIYLLE